VTGMRRPDGSPDGQGRRLVLRGPDGAVARSREFTRAVLHDWGWLPAPPGERLMRAEDVLLMVSELVTNACLHAGGPHELLLRRLGPVLRVEVSDGSQQSPVLRTVRDPALPGGHGLRVVDRLSLAWGSVPTSWGKTVWLETVAPSGDRPGATG
jgi:hypothetical protein